jgi:hypothetical protein
VILTARFEELIIYGKSDQWHGQPAEVVLHCRRDRVDIQVGIGDVMVIVGLETATNLINLRSSTALAVYALDIHA